MAKKRRKNKRPRKIISPGIVPYSQAVSTYGVGSIYELRRFTAGSSMLHSVMMLGLDWWQPDKLRDIHEPVLQQILGVYTFKAPPVSEEDEPSSGSPLIPATRFPKWLSCNQCKRLGRVPGEFDDRGEAGPKCNAGKCKGKGIPSRLITVCFSPEDGTSRGHIDEFPWSWWAHSESGGPCAKPQLKLEVLGKNTALSGLIVRCYSSECRGKVGRSLAGIFGEHVLAGLTCQGKRPWLNDQEECSRKVRTILRGGSNVYFSLMASALSIPLYSPELTQYLKREFKPTIRSILSGKSDIKKAVGVIRDDLTASKHQYTDDQIEEALRIVSGKKKILVKTEKDYRARERQALISGMEESEQRKSEFVAEPQSLEDLPQELSPFISSLVQVHRLREVRVLRGFTRVTPPYGMDPFLVDIPCAPLSRTKTDWLPAIEVRGEGIYLELNVQKIKAWEAKKAVKKRHKILQKRFNISREKGGMLSSMKEVPSAGYFLLHTLSHLLIRQLSLQCGYASASMRERLYVGSEDGEEWAGVLIYTASTAADGTLGGLVRQGEVKRFQNTFLEALEGAEWCSSDPLCIESRGQGLDGLNLSACHACCLVSETSCENRNLFLDRGFLLGTREDSDLAFFKDLLTKI